MKKKLSKEEKKLKELIKELKIRIDLLTKINLEQQKENQIQQGRIKILKETIQSLDTQIKSCEKARNEYMEYIKQLWKKEDEEIDKSYE